MNERNLVATRHLKFGETWIAPGERVPVEEGRNYAQLERLGHIQDVTAGATLSAPDGSVTHAIEPGDTAVFMDEKGAGQTVVFVELQDPDEETREALGLEAGEQAALVKFEGEEEPLLVNPGQLLPERAAELLTGAPAAADQQARLAEYVSVVGELLPSDYPGRAALLAAHVYTGAAVAALDDGALQAIKGVGPTTFASIRERTPFIAAAQE
jgi:hypothetical protein